MNNIQALVDQALALGAQFEIIGERVIVEAPSPLPSSLIERLRECKRDVLEYLREEAETGRHSHYNLVYPSDEVPKPEELRKIAHCVEKDGYILLWSTILQDLVAFYRDEEARSKIPAGFVPYSEDELWQLFGEEKPAISIHSLRLLHEAKKHGAIVTERMSRSDQTE